MKQTNKTKNEPQHEPLVSDLVIFYEIFTGSIELLMGIGLFLLQDELLGYYLDFRANGLLENHRIIISLLEKGIPYILSHYLWIGLFLFGLGLTKIICGIGLIKNRLWAKHLLEALILVFLPLDAYGLINHPTIAKVLLIAVNVLILYFLTGNKPFIRLKKIITSKIS